VAGDGPDLVVGTASSAQVGRSGPAEVAEPQILLEIRRVPDLGEAVL
jgi:hypothetical protein